jgi:cell wall-associated NlpC family hydrolase
MHSGQQITTVTGAYKDQAAVVAGYQGELKTLQGYQANYNTLLKVAGGNLSFLSDAGITANDIMNASGQQLKQYAIEVAAAAAAQRALGLGIGEAAAAQNAQTNIFMQETVPAMNKVTQAEDNLLNVILGGRTAFDAFQQSVIGTSAHFTQPSGLADAFKLAKGNLTGLNEQSLAYSNSLYNITIPALQKSIDATRLQGISQGDLTKIVATGSGEILKYTGNNKEARAVMVALINNALGPGTVSLQTLNKWVGTNSTSLAGYNSIIAKATIAAGALANVLQRDLTAQFQADLLTSSGATAQMKLFTDAIVHGGTQTEAYRSARQRLIDDLISTGMNANDAKTFVNNLQTQIDRMHGKTVDVTAHASGTGTIAASEKIPGFTGTPAAVLAFHAAGGKITGGTPGRDSVLGMLMPGEVVVPTDMVNQGAVDHLRGKLPGFARGGVVGSIGDPAGPEQWMTQASGDFAKAVAVKFMQDAVKKFKSDVAAAAATGSGGDIVKYAESFLGKIPYVWGGTSLGPAGADCSGFTSSVYGHFGINAPRTSEGQGAWVKRSPPTPGALAFYHSPPGGPDPGHVAIVAPGGEVVSQGGGMGPRMESLHFLPLLWTGVPPGGFSQLGSLGSAGNLSSNASIAAEEHYAASLFPSHGWSQGLMPALIALWNQESGWSPWAVNRGSGAYGIPQALPAVWDHPYALGDAASQIRWGENYIASTYGNPAAAWGHEVTHNWYRKGGAVGLAAGGVPARGRGEVPHMAAGGLAGIPPGGGLADPMAATVKQIRAVAAMRAKLAAYQAHEGEDYLGLRRAFLRGPAKYKSKAVMRDITRLYKQQGAEQVAYRHLAGAGLTGPNLGALGSAAAMVGETAGSRALTGLPGGHPGWSAGLRHWTSLLAGSGSAKLPAALTGIAALFASSRGHGTFTESAGPAAEWQYGTGLTGKLVPQSMDRGGWLSPGMNLVHNGLGRPEPVGAAAVPAVIQLEITGSGSGTFDAFLLKWLKQNVRVRGGGSVQKAFGGTGFR